MAMTKYASNLARVHFDNYKADATSQLEGLNLLQLKPYFGILHDKTTNWKDRFEQFQSNLANDNQITDKQKQYLNSLLGEAVNKYLKTYGDRVSDSYRQQIESFAHGLEDRLNDPGSPANDNSSNATTPGDQLGGGSEGGNHPVAYPPTGSRIRRIRNVAIGAAAGIMAFIGTTGTPSENGYSRVHAEESKPAVAQQSEASRQGTNPFEAYSLVDQIPPKANKNLTPAEEYAKADTNNTGASEAKPIFVEVSEVTFNQLSEAKAISNELRRGASLESVVEKYAGHDPEKETIIKGWYGLYVSQADSRITVNTSLKDDYKIILHANPGVVNDVETDGHIKYMQDDQGKIYGLAVKPGTTFSSDQAIDISLAKISNNKLKIIASIAGISDKKPDGTKPYGKADSSREEPTTTPPKPGTKPEASEGGSDIYKSGGLETRVVDPPLEVEDLNDLSLIGKEGEATQTTQKYSVTEVTGNEWDGSQLSIGYVLDKAGDNRNPKVWAGWGLKAKIVEGVYTLVEFHDRFGSLSLEQFYGEDGVVALANTQVSNIDYRYVSLLGLEEIQFEINKDHGGGGGAEAAAGPGAPNGHGRGGGTAAGTE